MAFAAAGMLGMELMEVLGGAAAVTEAVADVAAAAEIVAMEEAIPLMETAVGRTVTGEAVQSFAAYSGAARAGSIARAVGASGLVAAGVQGAMAARSFSKAQKKMTDLLGLGKRKRDGTGGTSSLSPAHPTRPALPLMPKRIQKAAKRAGKKTKKAKQKKSSKRKDSKRTKPRKKGPSRSRLVSYETHGLIQRDGVSYFGFQSTGGRDELMRGAAEALVKTLLRKFRIQIRSPDETLQITQAVPAVDKFKIFYRRRLFETGTNGGGTDALFDLNAVTYALLCDNVAASLRTQAEAGYFPYRMEAYNNGGSHTTNEVMRDMKFGEAKLSLAVRTRIKLRNITPNDGAGTDRFALDTNPLQGQLYKFSGDVPVVREGLYESDPVSFAKFHDRTAVRGVQFGPQRHDAAGHNGPPDTAAAIMGDNKVLSVPPRNGKMIWTNCVSSTPIGVSPGASVEHVMKYAYNGTLANFLRKFHEDQYTPPKLGVCHWVGLEQKFKQKDGAKGANTGGAYNSTNHDHVVIEYDVDQVASGGLAFAAAAKAPRTVRSLSYSSAPL